GGRGPGAVGPQLFDPVDRDEQAAATDPRDEADDGGGSACSEPGDDVIDPAEALAGRVQQRAPGKRREVDDVGGRCGGHSAAQTVDSTSRRIASRVPITSLSLASPCAVSRNSVSRDPSPSGSTCIQPL